MTEDRILILICVFVVIGRIPRIVERWKAPLLRGPDWFFSVAVPADFQSGIGAALLRNYRWRLFIPWAVEIPICAAILAAGLPHSYIYGVILAVTLLTRLNYYAARTAGENQAKALAGSALNAPPSAVALSLEPRSLRDYTNRWMEAAIVLLLAGSAAWLASRYIATPGWRALRGLTAVFVFDLYLQAGLLLLKRGCVRARVLAPVDNAAQYLAWRDSLRRLSTAMCDYIRLGTALFPATAILAATVQPWQGSTAQMALVISVLALTAFASWYEWRQRLKYLEVARRTRPANFLLLPDVPDARLICFRPSLPVLLLNSPTGYALNLASAPAKAAVLYFVGSAALWIVLTR